MTDDGIIGTVTTSTTEETWLRTRKDRKLISRPTNKITVQRNPDGTPKTQGARL